MSALVNGIINSTVGLLCSKLRDYTAEKLNEGDLNDEKFRQIVVRDIDDIKSKLNGLSRKDLLASLSFFKEGVTRLYISLETSGESRDQPRTSKENVEDEFEVEGATATKVEQFAVTQGDRDVLESVFQLSEIIGNLKLIASKERYKLVKESLKESRKLATEAFNNVVLGVEDRLMASKLRIVSRILDGLEDPDAAVHDCLLYLKELQDLPAVQTMFSLWRDSDKGIISRLQARFYKEKRNVNVESIQMINALLIDLTIKFTNIKMGLFNWPTITIGKDLYHPLLEDDAIKRKIRKKTPQLPWYVCKFDKSIVLGCCALTSKGEILSSGKKNREIIKVTRRGHEWCCTAPSKIRCFAVDENDNVYIVGEIFPRRKLLILDSDGNVKTDRYLDVIGECLHAKEMSVTKDGMIIIYSRISTTMYICDSTNAKQDYKFLLPVPEFVRYLFSFAVSNKNEIIFTFYNSDLLKTEVILYLITIDGKRKREVELPLESEMGNNPKPSVVFNHVNETILVSCCNNNHNNPITTIFCLSETGELLHQFDIPGEYHQLLSHPANSDIFLVGRYEAIALQM